MSADISNPTLEPKPARIYDFAVLRNLRKREGLTINDVAERSGVSTAVISKLERNQTSAELETLYKLGRVFGMSASDLIGLAESRMAHKVESTNYSNDGFNFEKIAYGNANCFHGNAKAGAEISRPEIHHDDYEICWVLEGSLELTLPLEKQVLNQGEAVQFDAIMQHSYRALEDTKFIICHIQKENRF